VNADGRYGEWRFVMATSVGEVRRILDAERARAAEAGAD
jgi:hypothetical protein